MSATERRDRKPLGRKSYGSIGHLPQSRMGPADRSLNPGQAAIATARTRDRHDEVFVQEKLDGSNVGVVKLEGRIIPLVRSGYVADSSPYEQHWRFGEWVYANQRRFAELLAEGERVCGEWLMQAHGTRYALRHEPFVAFDLMVGTTRASAEAVYGRCYALDFSCPALLHSGNAACSVDAALLTLGERGHHGALDQVEGAVWRVERKGVVDFLAKYVRPDKVDGCYLPGCNGIPNDAAPVWNWRPEWAKAGAA